MDHTTRLTALLMGCFGTGGVSLTGMGNSVGYSPVGHVLLGNGGLSHTTIARGVITTIGTTRRLPGCHIMNIGDMDLGGTNTCYARRLNCTLT